MRDNKHTFWVQGRFIDKYAYMNWTEEEKYAADTEERFLVRPSPTQNAICKCSTPGDAKWIAERLNLAAKLEGMGK